MIDTHAHIYLPDFTDDLGTVLSDAYTAGVDQIWLPGIDFDSLSAMESVRAHASVSNSGSMPTLRFFAGLHPCDVREDYNQQLSLIHSALTSGTPLNSYTGIGEIGLDLYWDKTYFTQQQDALLTQLDWAHSRNLPALIHVREAFDQIMPLIRPYYGRGLKAIFHSFAGTLDQALELTSEGFLLGINGTITYKNSLQAKFLSQIPLSSLVTETDAPFLTPVPFRGKRNEPKHIPLVVAKLAEIYSLSPTEIADITTATALSLLS
ncbi:MAG TPA: TatD family hydrolase [Bacteroidales bacterium]|nr:TatD family hydrolase [Bacteroidales bacterium]